MDGMGLLEDGIFVVLMGLRTVLMDWRVVFMEDLSVDIGVTGLVGTSDMSVSSGSGTKSLAGLGASSTDMGS